MIRLRRTLVSLLLLAVFGGWLAPSIATAEGFTASELADRARAAAESDDPAGSLVGIDSVDGRPIDLVSLTSEGSADDVRSRLQTLASALDQIAGSNGSITAEQARGDAAEIVAGLDPDSSESTSDDFGEVGEGGEISIPNWLLFLIGIGLIVAVVLFARGAGNRREMVGEAEGADELVRPSVRSELERSLAAAEAAGAYSDIVRLRFILAFAELSSIGAVTLRPSSTPGTVAAELGDSQATGLVHTFERVVYGRREATAEEAEAARRGWPEVISRFGR